MRHLPPSASTVVGLPGLQEAMAVQQCPARWVPLRLVAGCVGHTSLWGGWLACGVGGSARTAVVLHELASRARAWLRERAASGSRVFAISGAGLSLLCFAWHGGSHR